MASGSLPPIVQRIVVENPTAIPQALQQSAAAAKAAEPAFAAYCAQLEATAVATQQVTQASNQAAPAIDKVTYSTTEARVAAMGLGQELGVRMPRILSRFLSQSESIGPLLSKAFTVVAVVAMIEVVSMLADKIKQVAESVYGWDEATKKAYADNIAASDAALTRYRELKNKQDELALIGVSGPQKATIAIDNQVQAHKRLDTEVDTVNKHLRQVQDAVDISNLTTGSTKYLQALNSGAQTIKQLGFASKKDAEERLISLTDEHGKLVALQADAAIKAKELQKEKTVSVREQTLSEIEAQHQLDAAKIAGDEQAVRAQRAAFQITIKQEEDALVALEQKRLTQEKALLEAKAKYSGGKIGSTELGTQEADAVQQSENRINAIRTKAASERRAIVEAEAKVRIDIEKSAGEGEVKRAEQDAKQLYELHKIDDEAYRSLLLDAAAKENTIQHNAIAAEIAEARKGGEAKSAEVLRLEAQLFELEKQLLGKRAAINAEVDLKLVEETKRRVEEQVRAEERLGAEQLRLAEQAASERLKLNQITIGTWQRQEQQAIDQWYQHQLEVLHKAEADLRAAHLQDSDEYKRMLDRETQLKAQWALQQQKIDDQVATHWHTVQTQIVSQFNNTLRSIVTGSQTWQQGFTKLFDNLLLDAAEYFLKLEEMNAIHWAIQKVQDITGWGVKAATDATGAATAAAAAKAVQSTAAVATVISDAGVAAAGTLAYYSAFAPEIAPTMAALQFALTAAYLPSAAFAQGGVVPSDMIGQLHAKEMVLPAHLSEAVQNMTSTTNAGHTYNQHLNYSPTYNGAGGAMPSDREMANRFLREARRMNLR